MPTAPQKASKFHLKHHFHHFFSRKFNPKGFVGMWFVGAKKLIIIVVKLYRNFILISI
jgi:hypothetical protein